LYTPVRTRTQLPGSMAALACRLTLMAAARSRSGTRRAPLPANSVRRPRIAATTCVARAACAWARGGRCEVGVRRLEPQARSHPAPAA
jgi:hypothetical protein